MELYAKKPSKEAKEAMCEAAHQITQKTQYIKDAENGVCNQTNHEYAKIVNNGNSAILAAMSLFKGKIMLPDQGGWSGFIKIAKFLGLEIVYVTTDWGLIDPQTLGDAIDKEKPEALFLTSFAGYTAEQPLKQIYDVCSEKGVVLIEDASGALGDATGKLANGNHCHIMLASTGSPKIVNVGAGGFISTDHEEFLKNKYIFKVLQANHITCAGISQEINNAESILSETLSACNYLKNNLENVFHPSKRGVNVIIKASEPKKLANNLRSSLKIHGGGMISKCPRYDRLLDNAVALEIKNLDTRCLTTRNMDSLIEIIDHIKINH